jgi:hypothetical protein
MRADPVARSGHPNLTLRTLPGVARAWLSGAVAGALSGAVIGGGGGRIVMRIVYLIDDSTKGARTDFGDVGEVTLGGTFTLLILCTIAGTMGGLLYIGLRRWLPGRGAARGAAFGLVMMFGPALTIFNEDSPDLQIFEPILPILAMFIALVVLYGIATSLIADRLRAERPVKPGRRVDTALRGVWLLAAAWICFITVSGVFQFRDVEGTCLSADREGGCAARAPQR